jgi:hypothetical protein
MAKVTITIEDIKGPNNVSAACSFGEEVDPEAILLAVKDSALFLLRQLKIKARQDQVQDET